jgi:hypothetical protein
MIDIELDFTTKGLTELITAAVEAVENNIFTADEARAMILGSFKDEYAQSIMRVQSR